MRNSSSPASERFGKRFSVLARTWRTMLNTALSDQGLSQATWVPLIHLADDGDGLTQTQLAHRMCIDTSSLVRLLDILARQNLIERRPDPTDARAKRIFLTQTGLQRIEDISAVLMHHEAQFLAGLEEHEIELMLQGFDRIESNLNAARQRSDAPQPPAPL